MNTPSGVYKVRTPVGRIGAKHMSIMMQMPVVESESELTLKNEDIAKVFELWATQVLPHIIVDGPYKYDEMPGEDQFIIFVRMSQNLRLAEEFFQFE